MAHAGRIGLFGGTFDPPHRGHTALAQFALQHLQLDELRWLPAGQPWQKAGRVLAPVEHRLAMVRLCIEGQARQVLDAREVHRQGPSYTLDTVREVALERPDAELFLVIGQDQYARLDTWHGWQELIQTVTLAVAGRDGLEPEPPAALAAVPHRMISLPMPPVLVSSTAVREAVQMAVQQTVARGGTEAEWAELVGPAVAGYIAHCHLYQGSAAAH